MANKTENYELTKPLASEFYDVEVQNGNMNKIDAGMKANADAIKELQDGQAEKADLVDGKVPTEQLPAMDYEAKGTAATLVKEHNEDEAAHPYLLGQIGTCVTAAQNAQDAADAALKAVSSIAYTIDVVPTQNGTLTYTGSAQSPAWNSYNEETLTIGGVTSATDAGSYVATFTPKGDYHWSDGTQDTKEVIWTINRASVSVPTQNGTLTYTGSAQTPAWSNYDTDKMTLGGVTSATDAGSYNAIFTLGSNYQWADGTTAAKTVPWTIGKAAGSLTLNKTTLDLSASAKTGTIAVTRSGDGTITATSSNTGVATVSVSGTTVTVTAVAKGSATITVKVAEGTNYTAPSNKTCAVTVTLPTTTLNDNSWEVVGEVSAADEGANYWAVGDTKSITLNGAVGNFTFSSLAIDTFIIGFNHNSATEGTHRIHFQIGKINGTAVGLCDSEYYNTGTTSGYFRTNNSNSNSGGWASCYKRSTLYGNSGTPTSPVANSLMAALPSDLRAVMKSVTKYTDNTANGGGNVASYVTATTDYLFDLAEFEVFGSSGYANTYEANYQAQYDYYKAGNSKIAYNHSAVSTAVRWGLRSPCYSDDYYFCAVGAGGAIGYSGAYRSLALRPGFAA